MPSGAEEQFRSHRNYLRAYACLCGCEGSGWPSQDVLEAVAVRVTFSSRYGELQTRRETGGVKEALVNAWGTELLLAASGLFPDRLVAISNNWGVIQLYYAVFHAAQALTAATGATRPMNHQAIREQYLNLWVKPRGARSLRPWSLAYGHSGPINGPDDQRVDDWLNPWTACDCSTCWSLVLQSMRTSRTDGVEDRVAERRKEIKRERRRDWEERNRVRLLANKRPLKKPKQTKPKLTPDDRERTAAGVRPYSLLDYLFRLRLKTNYKDALMFTEGAPDDSVATAVHDDLVTIATCTLLAHELMIRQLVGRRTFETWVREWLSSSVMSGQKPIGLAARASLLLR